MQLIQTALCGIAIAAIIGCEASAKPFNPVEMVLRWGEGDVAHDLEVVNLILESTNGVRSADMDPVFFETITSRLAARPDLLPQLWRGFKADPPPCDDPEWFVERLYRNTGEYTEDPSRQGLFLLIFASMFGKPEWIVGLKWNDIPQHWKEARTWIEERMYYCAYNHASASYIVDEDLLARKIRVHPQRQNWGRCSKGK